MKRRPTPDEMSDWLSAEPRAARPVRSDEQALRHIIQNKNPVRWRRLQSDLRWMERQLVKLGRNPKEARWLL